MRHNVGVVRRGATPAPIAAVHDKRKDGVARTWTIDRPGTVLPLDAYPGVDNGNIFGQHLYLNLHQAQRRCTENVFKAISVRLADRSAIMPPKPCHIDEFGVFIEQRRKFVRVPMGPCLCKDVGDAFRLIERAVIQLLASLEGSLDFVQ